MITVTNNSIQQINAAFLAVIKEINLIKKEIKALKEEISLLEDTPSKNGVYKLQCTVSGGTVSYKWVAV